MVSLLDERQGLVKTCWNNISNRVEQVNPEFASLVNELSPDDSYPIYLAYYPYGEMKGDTISTFLPTIDGGKCRLNDPNISKDIKKDLGYGIRSSPLGMVLEKQLEYYVDLKELKQLIPWQIYYPGSFFPISRILPTKSNRIYTPNGLLSAVAGSRSVFMLPKVGCYNKHLMLKKTYNVKSQPPKALYDHWEIFKDIIYTHGDNCEWRTCIIYFSQKWVDKIFSDSTWHRLKKFLLEVAWTSFEPARNQFYHDIGYSLIQRQRNLKPNPYLVDTAKHLFSIALGTFPGFSPAIDEQGLPLKLIQEAYISSYGMKKYIPTIMEPKHFQLEQTIFSPVYYSLQHPSTISFSPKSRQLSSTLFEMRELNHVMNVFIDELNKPQNIFADTVLTDIAKTVKFLFYHNQIDPHRAILLSENIARHDERFILSMTKSSTGNEFASDSPFVRGCISVGGRLS